MIDVHVVNHHARPLYAAQLDELFRLRHHVFIGERKWLSLRADEQREVDRFDSRNTTYVLALDEAGGVAAGVRLHASVHPTPLSEWFPELGNLRGVGRAEDILEFTRFFVAPRFRSEGAAGGGIGIITCGLLLAALEEGATSLNTISDLALLASYVGLGWQVKVLGEPISRDGHDVVAFNVPIDDDMLESTRSVYGIDLPRLVRPAVMLGRNTDVSVRGRRQPWAR